MNYVKTCFIALSMLFSTLSYAQEDQTVIDIGVGISNSSGTRMGVIGLQEDLWGPIKQRFMVGGWLDNSGNGNSSSPLMGYQLGFEVNNNGLVMGVFSGPTWIGVPDQLLGGMFQFMSDIHLGIQDLHSNYIGVMYRHISSAGIESPNLGRDVIGLEIRYPF